jgi:hypothetical protein
MIKQIKYLGNYNFNVMDFKEFDELVKTYYPLNKEKSRYLILFIDGNSVFYAYDKINKTLKRESTEVF